MYHSGISPVPPLYDSCGAIDWLVSLFRPRHGSQRRCGKQQPTGRTELIMSRLPRRLDEVAPAGRDAIERRLSGSTHVPARIGRAVAEGVAVEHGRGLIQAARVRALEYVGNEALHAAATLTDLEALYLQRNPLGEARYRAIADSAAIGLARIVTETGQS